MKYIKTYEIKNSHLQDLVTRFFQKYEDVNNNENTKNLKKSVDSIYNLYNLYKTPDSLREEMDILIFLYNFPYFWKTGETVKDNYIKNKVKKYVLQSAINKIENDTQIYFDVKDCLDKKPHFNSSGKLGYIKNSTFRYIFFFLDTLERKTPGYIKDTIKYNI